MASNGNVEKELNGVESENEDHDGCSSTEEYRQRLQEAKDHRAHTLVAGDKKLPFIECLYDAGGGAIPQNVNQPLKAHQLYMDFEMFDDNAPTRARIEPTTYAEVTSKWTSSIRFVPKMCVQQWRGPTIFPFFFKNFQVFPKPRCNRNLHDISLSPIGRSGSLPVDRPLFVRTSTPMRPTLSVTGSVDSLPSSSAQSIPKRPRTHLSVTQVLYPAAALGAPLMSPAMPTATFVNCGDSQASQSGAQGQKIKKEDWREMEMSIYESGGDETSFREVAEEKDICQEMAQAAFEEILHNKRQGESQYRFQLDRSLEACPSDALPIVFIPRKAELVLKYQDLDDNFLKRLEKGVEQTNFDYGNQTVESKLMITQLEIVAKKYEALKKEVEDEKKNQAQPVNKDNEKLVFVLEKLVHQLETSNQSLKNVIDSCYETICSNTFEVSRLGEVQREQAGELAKLQKTIEGYEFDATVS
ncbi:Protein CBG16089 [Caenorhabditis briggsae]|uniref:Protein CBG16089 n=1 Tax=Caenorhabditis briggsae TaxID=6238 RepID=A8XN48_CAEBR|nr:Protein CBG16089 [Caenorhabditis briggsae]CAP34278.1 Protein CBG16089 [Caenorhabditis briggsae]